MSAKAARASVEPPESDDKEEKIDPEKLRDLAKEIDREAQRLRNLATAMEDLKIPPIKAMTGKFHSVGIRTIQIFSAKQVYSKLLSTAIDAKMNLEELGKLKLDLDDEN